MDHGNKPSDLGYCCFIIIAFHVRRLTPAVHGSPLFTIPSNTDCIIEWVEVLHPVGIWDHLQGANIQSYNLFSPVMMITWWMKLNLRGGGRQFYLGGGIDQMYWSQWRWAIEEGDPWGVSLPEPGGGGWRAFQPSNLQRGGGGWHPMPPCSTAYRTYHRDMTPYSFRHNPVHNLCTLWSNYNAQEETPPPASSIGL